MGDELSDSSVTGALLREVEVGDRAALERLLDLHRDEVRKMVYLRLERGLAARVDASDIVQETMMEVAHRLPEFLERSPMPFRVWLRCTALDKLCEVRRRHFAKGRSVKRESTLPEDSTRELAHRLKAADLTPSALVQQKETNDSLRRAIEQLEEDDQEIVLMRWVEDLPYAEIGLVLDITPATARKRHGRALARLGAILRKNDITGPSR